MTEEKNKKINNAFTIITVLLYVVAIIIYELLFCNSELINNALKGNSEELIYNFSLFRLILYVTFIGIFIKFRKYFTKDLIKTNSNKVKRILVILYSILAVIGVCVVTIFIFTTNIPLQRIAMLYIAIIMGEICLVYLSNNHIKNIIVITFTLAMIFVVTVDINNAIDENKHFMSAYNVSIGNFDYVNNPKIDKKFFALGTRVKYTNTSELFRNDFKEELTDEINKENIAETAADYGPITYLPSGIGIAIARVLSSNMADMYFAGRLFNLLTFMGLIICAFKILPYKKNTFFVVLTMPMLLLMSTVYSADMLAIAMSTIFIAYCLKLYEKENINIKDIMLLIGAVALLCIPKSMAYAPIALIVFILPIKKIIKQNKKYIPIAIITGIILLISVIFLFSNKKIEDDGRGGAVNSKEQIEYLTSQPLSAVKLGINHIRLTLLNFDWLAQLNMSIFFCDVSSSIFLLMLLFILLVSLTDTSKNFKIKDRIIFILTFLIIYGINSLVLYIKFTPVGNKTINGFQPRYIFPIIPLALMTLSNNLVKMREKEFVNMGISIVSMGFLMLGVIGNIMVL